ncbi:MAG TPA: helix-turn-helix domain-containing protein [Anaerovoracaceae bacterium]|nr:helix-turn-helix domain-containing protein [Anaerovoracaceae bacterium]HYE68335.1 helix-turn-helix domain-containing protein [Anaerovoracaceae bacterium]
MNLYVSAINEIIEYIECNIGESLPLTDLSTRAGISDFHFNRIFKTVTGITLKQYVLGRKLTKALEQLRNTDKSVIEIAMDLGFDYPEVFSRAFKKQFGLSPTDIRNQKNRINGIKKAAIVERDIINYRGTLALKGNSVFLDAMKLNGVNVKADTNSDTFKQNLKTSTETFILESANNDEFKQEKFYTIVSCGGNDNGEYNVFCGRQPVSDTGMIDFDEYNIPDGWYVDFIYHGDMFDIREVFIDDLYKWIMVKEAEMNPNGIGMLNIYDNNYPEDNKVHILVPIKKPI